MLVDRVLADLDLPADEDRQGNPLRGSRLGRCARQSAYMLWPARFPPEPLPARTKLVFAFGDMIHDLVRANFRRVCPGEWGAEEMRLHFVVPLTTKEVKAAKRLFASKALRGQVTTSPPTPRGGLTLDTAACALHVPLHVDGIADAGPDGLATAEIKSMTSAAFRWALAGKVEYSYRVQMATAVDAGRLDAALYVAVNKNTCHLLEILYSKRAEKVTITFTKQSRLVASREVYLEGYEWGRSIIDPPLNDDKTPMDDWEAARVDHPFEPALLDEARARVKKILLATPTKLPAREYGPDFKCGTCDGTGMQTHRKGSSVPLIHGPKPCKDCEPANVVIENSGVFRGVGMVSDLPATITSVGAPSGQLAEAELPWQCRYCASIVHCWGEVKPRLEFDREGKPHYWITRQAFQESGIVIEGPKG